MAEEDDEEEGASSSSSSALGTKVYWDGVYARELSNFAELGDEGADWYSETVGDRLVEWVCRNVPQWVRAPAVDTLDVGCGNGAWLFAVEARRSWPGALVGCDYSAAAVELATAVAQRRGSKAAFRTRDLREHSDDDRFAFVHDKGTYDAFRLSEGADAATYVRALLAALRPGGCFVVSSCNFTADELEHDLLQASAGRLALRDRLPHPTFRFAGREGAAVVTLAFQDLRS